MEDKLKKPEEILVEILKEKKLKIATAESCTGGMIASAIVNVSGASEVFDEGFVTYANEAKIKYLNVKKETIEAYNVVSEEVVKEMAEGCAKQTGANLTITTSGVAGPGGGTKERPVGLVCFGCFYNGIVTATSKIFDGDRMQIREQATEFALAYALNQISGKKCE